MNEEYFSFGEKEISWLKGRDPELGTVISRMEKPKRKLLPDLFSGLVFLSLLNENVTCPR